MAAEEASAKARAAAPAAGEGAEAGGDNQPAAGCVSIRVDATDAWCANTCAGGRCPEDLCKCGAAAVGVASARPVAKGNVKPPPAAHAPDAEDREVGWGDIGRYREI